LIVISVITAYQLQTPKLTEATFAEQVAQQVGGGVASRDAVILAKRLTALDASPTEVSLDLGREILLLFCSSS